MNMPAGHLVERHSDYLVRTIGEFASLDDVRSTVIGATAKGQPLYIRDVAEVKDTLKESRYIGRIEGEKAVFLMVSKRSGSNTALVGKAVKAELENIKKTLPPDIKFLQIMDQSEMIQGVTQGYHDNGLAGRPVWPWP